MKAMVDERGEQVSELTIRTTGEVSRLNQLRREAREGLELAQAGARLVGQGLAQWADRAATIREEKEYEGWVDEDGQRYTWAAFCKAEWGVKYEEVNKRISDARFYADMEKVDSAAAADHEQPHSLPSTLTHIRTMREASNDAEHAIRVWREDIVPNLNPAGGIDKERLRALAKDEPDPKDAPKPKPVMVKLPSGKEVTKQEAEKYFRDLMRERETLQARVDTLGDQYIDYIAELKTQLDEVGMPPIEGIPGHLWREAIERAPTKRIGEAKELVFNQIKLLSPMSEYRQFEVAQAVIDLRDPEVVYEQLGQCHEYLGGVLEELKKLTTKGALRAIK